MTIKLKKKENNKMEYIPKFEDILDPFIKAFNRSIILINNFSEIRGEDGISDEESRSRCKEFFEDYCKDFSVDEKNQISAVGAMFLSFGRHYVTQMAGRMSETGLDDQFFIDLEEEIIEDKLKKLN